ncbi:MAG: transglycosylase SLT domain-containing protein [Limisphaerales bacterium]
MKVRVALLLLLAGCFPVRAQQDTVTLDDLLQNGQQWLQENLDENWLRSLPPVDQDKVQQFLRALQQRFQGEYVIDLASLKQTADVVLPLLERSEETQSYASWLRAQWDYLDVADEFRLIIPPPKAEPGQPARPAPNPTPQLERQVWRKHLATRPLPKAAEAYVPRLKPVFAAQGIPIELVWLAEVESSFDPKAHSPVGAAGLFQLMPATARQNGLTLRPEDERLQPEKSARAAAVYLKHLHTRFGDWPLALAAYNAGEGRVQGLLEKDKARTFDRIARQLPAETQMYVPRVEATLLRREGITLAELETQ